MSAELVDFRKKKNYRLPVDQPSMTGASKLRIMKYTMLSIAGYDRSGTTFLGKLLNKYEDAFFIGELDRGLEKYKNGEFTACGCGSEVPECPVWGTLLGEATSHKHDLTMYSKISEQTGAQLLIDSSKRMSQLKGISSYMGEGQLILHIIRNPKGVIYSRMKTRKRRVQRNTHPKPHIARLTNLMMIYDSLEWCYRNIQIETFKKPKKQVLTVFYEDLETDYFERLLPFLEGQGNLNLQNFKNKPEDHILFGNVNRRKPIELPIQIDQGWKDGLNWLQKGVVDLITFPVRRYYNYRF